MGALNPNSRGHGKAWESLTQLEGPRQSVGVLNPNSRGHTMSQNPGAGGWGGVAYKDRARPPPPTPPLAPPPTSPPLPPPPTSPPYPPPTPPLPPANPPLPPP